MKKRVRQWTSEERAYFAEYDKNNTTSFSLRLNKSTDGDILKHLETVGSKQGYIKALIRADIGS